MKTEKIKINQIIQNDNCRNRDVEIASLMDSIKHEGLLEPIGVAKIAMNKYEVLYGNRRFQAVKKLGRYEIDAIVHDIKDKKDFKIINLIENLQRQDITIEDQGRVIQELRKLKMTDGEIAVRLSLPLSRIKKMASCFMIPEEYKQHISKVVTHGCGTKNGKVPMSTADAIIKVRRDVGMNKKDLGLLFEHAKHDNFGNENVRMVAGLVKQGHTVKEAISMQNEFIMVRVNVPIDKEQMTRLLKKHKTDSKADIIMKVISGKIRERLITYKY